MNKCAVCHSDYDDAYDGCPKCAERAAEKKRALSNKVSTWMVYGAVALIFIVPSACSLTGMMQGRAAAQREQERVAYEKSYEAAKKKMTSKEAAVLEQIHPITYRGEDVDEAVIHGTTLYIWSHLDYEDRELANYMARDLLERYGGKAVDCVWIKSWDDDDMGYTNLEELQ